MLLSSSAFTFACFCPKSPSLPIHSSSHSHSSFFSALTSPVPPGPLCNTLLHQSNHSMFLTHTSGRHSSQVSWIPPTSELHQSYLTPACPTMAGSSELLSQLAFSVSQAGTMASPGLMLSEDQREQGAKVATTR